MKLSNSQNSSTKKDIKHTFAQPFETTIFATSFPSINTEPNSLAPAPAIEDGTSSFFLLKDTTYGHMQEAYLLEVRIFNSKRSSQFQKAA